MVRTRAHRSRAAKGVEEAQAATTHGAVAPRGGPTHRRGFAGRIAAATAAAAAAVVVVGETRREHEGAREVRPERRSADL